MYASSRNIKGYVRTLQTPDSINYLKDVLIENATISGSTINSSIIGSSSPASIYATTLQTGDSTGNGYDVIFYGSTQGEYLRWDSALGILEIEGEIQISQGINFGNLRISGNTLLSTNTNGNIILDPNGTGSIRIPYDTKLSYGIDSNYMMTTGSNNMIIESVNSLTITSPTTTIDGSLITTDSIFTLGQDSILDNEDRGIEFKYYTGTSKLGFFGYDSTDGYFMYIPDATNTSEVISGALGNAKFAIGSFTSLNLNNGNISNVDTISSTGDLAIQPGTASDLILNVDSGSNIIIPPNVDLLFDGESSKIYSDGTSLHIDVIGGDLDINTNTVVDGDLTVTGNVNFTGTVTSNFTVERLNIPGGNADSPSNGSNITFVTVTGSGIATGSMPAGVTDGFFKTISISQLDSGCSYELTFPIGTLVDPVSGTTDAKKIIFDSSGQGIQLVWDNIASRYVITQGGGSVVAA